MTVQDKDDVDCSGQIIVLRQAWNDERDREFPDHAVQLDLAKALLRSDDRLHHLEAQDILDGTE